PTNMSPADRLALFTGPSGFVASHIVHDFLRAGYKVRGSVRSAATAEKVRQSFPQYAAEQRSLVVVEDVAQPGAFDTAVEGVHGVIYTAAP
ncbi:hypothetical protein BP00DRAFT_307294, partial [Aspergillus indologenus CBS 114.80]